MDMNEKVGLSVYNVDWANQFAEEKKILQVSFPDAHIEHVGSTSIEGMTAKPVIDIMIGIDAYPPPDEMTVMLKSIGYIGFGEASKLSDRLYLVKRGVLNYNAHVTEYLGKFWNHMTRFRDYLKAHEDEVLRYSEIKRSIVDKGKDTLFEYSDEKGNFIESILEKINHGA